MNEEREKEPRAGPERVRRISREEQGDLLADAVTGLFADQVGNAPVEEEPGEVPGPEGASPDTHEPMGTEESGEEGDDDTARVVEVIPDSPWEQKMAWAKERARDGRVEEAEELYRELVDEDPTNVRALNNLGVLLDEMGDSEGAVSFLRRARRADPQNLEVLGNLGAALGTMGKYGEAEDELRMAFRTDPTNLEIRANLGILLFKRGLYDQAVAELEVVCKGKPDDGHPFYYLGEALNRLGRVDEAIRALNRVTDLLPEHPKAYYTLGVLYDKKNLPERAASMYRKARELSGS